MIFSAQRFVHVARSNFLMIPDGEERRPAVREFFGS
jgi:hypothetical protein